MQAAASISEAPFGQVFELSATGMAVLAPDSRVQHANRSFCELLGYTLEDLGQLPPHALSHPADWQDEVVHRGRVFAGAASYQREHRFLHRDGSVVWAKLTCTSWPDENDGARRLWLQVQDITRAKMAEAAARESEEHARVVGRRLHERMELLDQSREGIVVHAMDGTIRFWNRGAQRMFGYTREQATGQTFEGLMGLGAALQPAAWALLMDQGEWVGELDCVDAAGRTIAVERRCCLTRDAAGIPAGVMSVDCDVTERRRAEKEIVLLNNVLEQRIRKRTEELEESNEDLRDFAYSLAHDLRAPLSSIDGFSAQLELRLAEHLDDRSRHYLNRVRAGVRLMADLTDALLALADLSNTQLLHQNVDLSAVARNIVERLREQHPHRDVAVVVEDTPPAQGDIRLLADVLENLLGNAWKFTSRLEQAQIVFGGQSWPNGSYLYHVKDNGAGFDPDYAYKLFGPFQRLHTADEFEGTGIGLAMVRKIVSRHGGRVWAEGAPGEGASFFFTLNENAPARVARETPLKATTA